MCDYVNFDTFPIVLLFFQILDFPTRWIVLKMLFHNSAKANMIFFDPRRTLIVKVSWIQIWFCWFEIEIIVIIGGIFGCMRIRI